MFFKRVTSPTVPQPQNSKSQRPKSPTSDTTTGTAVQEPPRKRTRRNRRKKPKLDSRTPSLGHITAAKPIPDEPDQRSPEPVKPPTDSEAPFILVSKAPKKANATRPQPTKKATLRPVVVLVKVSEGRTYADTLRAVRDTVIDFDSMGTRVTSMKRILKGDLLVGLTKGAKAMAATAVIRDKLAATMPDTVVTRLRHTTEVEIVDLDEITTREEVRAAIVKSMHGDDPPADDQVKVTGLWAT